MVARRPTQFLKPIHHQRDRRPFARQSLKKHKHMEAIIPYIGLLASVVILDAVTYKSLGDLFKRSKS